MQVFSSVQSSPMTHQQESSEYAYSWYYISIVYKNMRIVNAYRWLISHLCE